ncbi:unnamed protein product [Fraxinus pennsylvanica]|uniref:Reticulon-like protein n=1 Tax=Fraxinus pennsylvanica TaxID=56036 RepID=A0AAD2E433_9LAMI|nr:unnamed protein product [Fraxinus pennsylvanica]
MGRFTNSGSIMAMTILLPLRPPPMINIHVSRQEKFHLFGRQKQMHKAFSGGKPADVVIWRNKQMSGGLLADATVIWLLFEWIGYHLINFLCHSLILSLATLFLWSNLSYSVNRSASNFPQIVLPEDLCMNIALLLRDRCNQAFGIFRLKKFLYELSSPNELLTHLIFLKICTGISYWIWVTLPCPTVISNFYDTR